MNGNFRVEWVAGLLPAWGIGMVFEGDRGTTTLFGVPVARFTLVGDTLIYAWLPVRDRLTQDGEDWEWRGMLGRDEFCRFQLRAGGAVGV